MLLSLAANFPCGKPSCWKYELTWKCIHLGTAGGLTAARTLSPGLAKPKVEIHYKIQEAFRGGEIRGGWVRDQGGGGLEVWSCRTPRAERHQERSCVSGIRGFITEQHPGWAQYVHVLPLGHMHTCPGNWLSLSDAGCPRKTAHSRTGKTNTHALQRRVVPAQSTHGIDWDPSSLSIHLYPAPQAPPFCFPHCSHSNRNLVTSPSNYSLLTASSCLRIKTKALREAYRAPAHFTALCPCSLLQPPWPVSFSTSPCFLQPQDIGTRSSLWHLTPPPQPRHSFHLSAQLLLPQKAILLQHMFAWHRVHPPWLLSPCNLY